MAPDLIDQLVAKLLASAGVPSEPPIDLVALANALGVDQIKPANMTEDGRLEQRGGQAAIWLRTDVPAPRQRFTLAHELGHLVLANPARDFIAHRAWTGPDREERFCDQFAAALLLPRWWVVQNFSQRPEELATVRELATATGASLSASLVRLRELVGWHTSLLHWRRHNGQWALLYSAGVPRRVHHRVATRAETRAAIDGLAGATAHQRVDLPLIVADHLCQVPAEVSISGTGVVALVDLTEAAKLAAR